DAGGRLGGFRIPESRSQPTTRDKRCRRGGGDGGSGDSREQRYFCGWANGSGAGRLDVRVGDTVRPCPHPGVDVRLSCG
ncbi:unnamed protein product, partial [Scytosiphon promiscuus]